MQINPSLPWYKIIFRKQDLFLLAVTLFIRFPFFFRDIMDHDESTFILIGQSIADGHLPYDHLWDLKPPLLFYLFGLVEYLFPYSLVAVRIMGVLAVFLSAVFLTRIAGRLKLKNGFEAGIIYILLSSLFGNIQGVMSEHLSTLFFLGGLLFYCRQKNWINFLLTGFFIGCSLLCKLNMAYPALALILFHLATQFKSYGIIKSVFSCFLIGTGILIPVFLISIPFLIENKTELFIDSVFMATLEYGHKPGFTVAYRLMISYWIILLSLFIVLFALYRSTKENRKQAWLFTILLMSTVYTYYSSASVTGHYLIQIFPLMSILVLGFIIRKELVSGYKKYILFILLLSPEAHYEYYRIGKQFFKTGSFYNGKAFKCIEILKKNNLDEHKIFFTKYHIAYWFLREYPLTKSVTHPSSLVRPEFFKYFGNSNNSIQEMEHIFDEIRPDVIVSDQPRLGFFKQGSDEDVYFLQKVSAGFDLIYEDPVDRIYIWKRKS